MTNKLTNEEIEKYIKQKDKSTGVDAITREMLENINLDDVEELIFEDNTLKTADGKIKYKLERFTPRVSSYAFKPSFAGRQFLLGRQGRILFFSDGRWFV